MQSGNEKDRLADALAAMSGSGAGGAGPASRLPAATDLPPAAPSNLPPAPGTQQDEPVAAPAPDRSVFAPRQTTAQILARQRIEQKRTLIPILLTCGVLLPMIGSLRWFAGPDSVFAEMQLWVPVALAGVGALLVAVAVLNALQVRDALRSQPGRTQRHAV